MQSHRIRRFKRILTIVLLYLILCGFLWCFLLVEARSYNRMSHTPVAMAQVQFAESQITCALADNTYHLEIPAADDAVCFWLEVLSDPAVSVSAMLWELLSS